MKIAKKIIISFIVLFAVLFFFFGSRLFCNLEVKKEVKKELFDFCGEKYDFSTYPKKLTNKLLKRKVGDYDAVYMHDTYDFKNEGKKRDEFARSLGDKIEAGNKKSVMVEFPTVKNDTSLYGIETFLYYNYLGNLLYVEKRRTLPKSKLDGVCRYSTKGDFLEASYLKNELTFVFNPKKQLIYRCYRGGCATIVKYKMQDEE